MSYNDYVKHMLALTPRVAILSERGWKEEGSPSADQWMQKCRGVNYETAKKYPNARAWIVKDEPDEPKEPKKRGRPKGAKNKPKRYDKKGKRITTG